VATDGHRLAHIMRDGFSFDVVGEVRTLIPRKAMAELLSLLSTPEVEFVEFARDDSTLFFRLGSRLLTSRQLTGQFPNYEAVLPKEHNKGVSVRTSELQGALQRVAQFADERSGAIKMRFEKNELRISSSSTETGESEDSLETPYDGDPISIGFNSQYLIEFLKVTESESVRIEFKDAQSAGQLRPEGVEDYKYRYVVMPMRI